MKVTENTITTGIRCKIKLPSRNRTSKETTIDPFFPVEFVNLTRQDTGEEVDSRLIVNGETRKSLGMVGAGYQLFTNRQASDTVKEFLTTLDTPYESMGAGTASAGARFFETIKFPGLEFNASTGIPSTALDNKGLTRDTFIPILTIKNSYDRTSAISWKYGIFRVVCKNGMAIKTYEQTLSFKHNQILNVEAVRSNLIYNLENTVKIMETAYNKLNEVGGNAYLNSLLTGSFSDRYKKLVLDKMTGHFTMDSEIEEREGVETLKINAINTPLSAYAIYNVMTEVTSHEIKNLSERSMIDDKIAKMFQISA